MNVDFILLTFQLLNLHQNQSRVKAVVARSDGFMHYHAITGMTVVKAIMMRVDPIFFKTRAVSNL